MVSTVYIAKNVYGGDGLGRLGDGRVVFVPGAFAGENVKAEIVLEKRGFVKAKLIEIVEASPSRIGTEETAIPGMVYANLDYAAERATKQQQLAEFFERARIPIPAITEIAVGSDKNYRNKVVYHFARQDGHWVLGYRKEPSHIVVDVTNDPLARPEINAKLPEIRGAVFALLTQGAKSVRESVVHKENVTIRWSARSGVKWWLGDAPKDVVLKEDTANKIFEVPAGGFYQVNPEAGERLVNKVVELFKTSSVEAGNLLDLYCGVGVFGLCCEPQKLIGIESGNEAITFARRNALAQNFTAKFFAEQVGRNLGRIPIGKNTTVIIDPPRDGLEPKVPMWLARSPAPKIIYVSCDPATLMRDLKIITKGYQVESVDWIDMFPRTARFETVVSLKKL